jgi:predicted dehydrogenase
MHGPYTIRALEAGKHVICEKPMTMNAPEAMQMIDVAKKRQPKIVHRIQNALRQLFWKAKRHG